MTQKMSLRDLPLKGKKLILRVDFNVPLNKDGQIRDDSRIQAALPSIRYALQQGASIILLSHMGRPKGKKDPTASLATCAKRLEELLQQPVFFCNDCIGPEAQKATNSLQPGQVILMENLRFYKAEEEPAFDPLFARQLAKLGDLYADDAFGAAHRAHASITELPSYFPGQSALGFLMEKEVTFLGEKLSNPARPFYALLGGAKISSKIDLLRSLTDKVDGFCIGGAMAFTFLKAQGFAIGNSLFEPDFIESARATIDLCMAKQIPLLLPVDSVIVPVGNVEGGKEQIVSMTNGIPDGFEGVDIGPKTIELFKKNLKLSATIFWNGPLGLFEVSSFAKGTNELAQFISTLSACTIVGGGDSVAALQGLGVADKISHLSTGGGASLEFLEQGSLVGIEALSDATSSNRR